MQVTETGSFHAQFLIKSRHRRRIAAAYGCSRSSRSRAVKCLVLGAFDDFFLKFLREVAEIIAVAGHADDEVAVFLLRDRATLERATAEAEQVMYAALRRGLNFKITMGNVLTLTPALTITPGEMDQALGILERCIGQAQGSAPVRKGDPP